MEIRLESDDLFSHMVLLGLAQILRWEKDDPVVFRWISPELAQIDRGPLDLSIHETALAVWNYKELIQSEIPAISRVMTIAPKGSLTENETSKGKATKGKHVQRSPLSPRIGPLSSEDLRGYYKSRQDIVDSIESDNALLPGIVGSLGSPSYWERTTDKKDKPVPDRGASKWEMADRRRGDEFFRNDYLDIFYRHIVGYSIEEVEEHLKGSKVTEDKESYTCGFRAPSKTDVMLAWIAYQGFASFPTRPATGCHRRSALSASTVEAKSGRTWFVLPLPEESITLERYLSICRGNALISVARRFIPAEDQRSSDWQGFYGRSQEYLDRHGIDRIVLFEKIAYKASKSDTSYWALPGKAVSIDWQ